MSIFNKYLKYKNKYLELKKQLGGTKEKQEVYMPFFHSCHLDTIETVPDGSTIVFSSGCGLKVADDDRVSVELRKMFLSKNPIIQEPEKNRDKIIEILGHPVSIHTSSKNNKFLDLRFNLHGLFNELENHECSGLHKVSTDNCNKLGVTFTSVDNNIVISKENALQLYKNSVFPTEMDIAKMYDDNSVSVFELNRFMKIIGNIKLSELLEKFPGIYYIYGCRKNCKGIDRGVTKIQRSKSISQLSDKENKIAIEKFISSIVLHFLKEKKYHKLLEEDIILYKEKYGRTAFILDIKEKISALIKSEGKKKYYIKILQIIG